MSGPCGSCVWLSTGIGDDVRGSGYCYCTQDYRDNDDTCPFWQASLRDEPVNAPELRLVQNVAAQDTGVED